MSARNALSTNRPLPPAVPFCRRCGGRGFVLIAVPREREGRAMDACPICSRAAEARWRGVQIRKLTLTNQDEGLAA